MNTLWNHANSNPVTRETVKGLATPMRTKSHVPIAHFRMLDQVEHTLQQARIMPEDFNCIVSHDGNRMFALYDIGSASAQGSPGNQLELPPNSPLTDFRYQIGVRNSHDKAFSASVCMGTSVVVCDNLCFSGQVQLSRKHTSMIAFQLPGLITRAVGEALHDRGVMAARFDHYFQAALDDRDAHHIICEWLRAGALAPNKAANVISEWHAPSHDEFAARNAWSLLNAMTETNKYLKSPHDVAARSHKATKTLDKLVSFIDTLPPLCVSDTEGAWQQPARTDAIPVTANIIR